MKKIFYILLIFLLIISTFGCMNTSHNGDETQYQNNDIDEKAKPCLAGISLGDSKNVVIEKLGTEYEETNFEEAGHFPENFYSWEYDNGTLVYIGRDSGKVLEIRSTGQEAETNLGIKVGDRAELVFDTYRAKYTEPVSIHTDDILVGVFKIEENAIIIFDFNMEDGITNLEEVNSDDLVERIILTHPTHIDDSF